MSVAEGSANVNESKAARCKLAGFGPKHAFRTGNYDLVDGIGQKSL